MKKIFLIFIFLFFSIYTYSQISDSIAKCNKWEIDINYYPSYNGGFYEKLSKYSTHPIGFSILIGHHATQNFTVNAGINLKLKKICEEGFIIHEFGGGYISTYKRTCLERIFELPINLEYRLIDRPIFSAFFNIGFTNYFHYVKSINEPDFGGRFYTTNYYLLYYNLFINIGLGGKFYLTEKIALKIQPEMGYVLIGEWPDIGLLGVRIGIVYRF